MGKQVHGQPHNHLGFRRCDAKTAGCAATNDRVCAVFYDRWPARKAVGESRERVRAAFASIELALPPKRIIVNLAPADLPKQSSHYDLAIALAMLAAMGVIALDALDGHAAIGELS